MVADHSHDCQQKERIIDLEKQVTRIENEQKHLTLDIEKQNEILEEIRDTINGIRDDVLKVKGGGSLVKWFMEFIGISTIIIIIIALTKWANGLF